MTDCQAWRQRNKMTNGKKEREKALTAQLHLPFIEASDEAPNKPQ